MGFPGKFACVNALEALHHRAMLNRRWAGTSSSLQNKELPLTANSKNRGRPCLRSGKGWTVLPLSEKQKVLPEYGSVNCSGCAAICCPHLNQVVICKSPYLKSQTPTQVLSSGNSLTRVGLLQFYSSLLRTVTLKAISVCSPLLQHFKKFWWKPAPRQRLHKCWNTEIKQTHHRFYKYLNFRQNILLGCNTTLLCTEKIEDLILGSLFLFIYGVKK